MYYYHLCVKKKENSQRFSHLTHLSKYLLIYNYEIKLMEKDKIFYFTLYTSSLLNQVYYYVYVYIVRAVTFRFFIFPIYF